MKKLSSMLVAVVLMVAILAASSTETFAQAASTQQQTNATPPASLVPVRKPARTKRTFIYNNKLDWSAITGACGGSGTSVGPSSGSSGNPSTSGTNSGSSPTAPSTPQISDACVQAAIVQVTTECAGSARFFQKAALGWQALEFGLLIASAGFTGVGASAT